MSDAPFDTLNLARYVGDDPDRVAENIRRVARSVGMAHERVAVMDSVHGARVAEVSGPDVVEGVDGLVTRQPGLVLLALGADCVPLALVGDDDITVAVAHCGWRGLVADIVGETVAAMRALGCGVSRAVLGASVCGRCYPVPRERAEEVADACAGPVAGAALVRCADGQPGIDVGRGVVARLAALGVAPEAVHVAGRCTVEDVDLFSYRRDGVTGRQGIAVARMPA